MSAPRVSRPGVAATFRSRPSRRRPPERLPTNGSARTRPWTRAKELERHSGLAVCDTDPFELHYAWGMWRIGEWDRARWRHCARLARAACAAGSIGLADLVLVAEAEDAELTRRRRADAARGRERRRFELHRRLRKPLHEWYASIDRIEPGRVRWGLPADGDLGPALAPRVPRSGPELFDALLAALPTR